MSITSYQSNKILDRNFGNTSFTVASPMYVGLSTTPIQLDGTGETEPSGGSYARVSIANNKTTWGTAADGVLSNDISIQFPESTAAWGTITSVFIVDASTSGNIMFFEVLDSSRTVADVTTVLFAAGGFEIQMNNS